MHAALNSGNDQFILLRKLIPVQFDGYMQSGGSTKPWRVLALRENAAQVPETFVVKLFTKNNVTRGHSIAKEFIGNALAREFDFEVPEACLIKLHSDDFMATLPDDALNVLKSKYNGATYASRLLDATLVNEQLERPAFTMYDCASLFAFDCMILNVDRGGFHNKPNLLMDDSGFILIDHELSLNVIDTDNAKTLNKILADLESSRWGPMYSKHLFYNRLKSYRGNKRNLFDTFSETLVNLDIRKIETFIETLSLEGVDVGETDFLISYLRTLKQNCNKFCNLMLGLIA